MKVQTGFISAAGQTGGDEQGPCLKGLLHTEEVSAKAWQAACVCGRECLCLTYEP